VLKEKYCDYDGIGRTEISCITGGDLGAGCVDTIFIGR